MLSDNFGILVQPFEASNEVEFYCRMECLIILKSPMIIHIGYRLFNNSIYKLFKRNLLIQISSRIAQLPQ